MIDKDVNVCDILYWGLIGDDNKEVVDYIIKTKKGIEIQSQFFILSELFKSKNKLILNKLIKDGCIYLPEEITIKMRRNKEDTEDIIIAMLGEESYINMLDFGIKIKYTKAPE